VVSPETIHRVLHRLGFRWRRPRPVSPGEDSEKRTEQKRVRLEDVLQMVKRAGSFFQDETRLETNPKVGFCWMRKGKRRSPFLLQGQIARRGSVWRSTSIRVACTG